MRTDLRVKHDIEPGIAAIRFFVCSGAMRPRSTFVFPPCALQHCCKKSGCGRFFAGMPHNIVRLRIGVFRDLGKRIPRAALAAFFGLKLRHTRKNPEDVLLRSLCLFQWDIMRHERRVCHERRVSRTMGARYAVAALPFAMGGFYRTEFCKAAV